MTHENGRQSKANPDGKPRAGAKRVTYGQSAPTSEVTVRGWGVMVPDADTLMWYLIALAYVAMSWAPLVDK